MNSHVKDTSWLPEGSWWAILACVITAGLLGNWFIAAGVMIVLLFQVFRPFDFVAAHLFVVVGSAFVNYRGGQLTRELGLLAVPIMFMLICYMVTNRGRAFAMPVGGLGWALASYVLLSMANFARGLVGNPIKAVLLEVLPVLAIGTTFLVANRFEPRRDMRFIVLVLTALAFGSAFLGYQIFAVIRTHAAGIWFSEVPGLVALLFVNLALRTRSPATAAVWLGLSLPLFLHQFLSFRRALWLGCMVGFLSSILIFAIGRSRRHWTRVGLIAAALLGIGAVGAASLELVYGQTDILSQSWGRFTSIGSTELSMETRSNVARLAEIPTALKNIQQSPWIGHGLGFTWVAKDPLDGTSVEVSWLDQYYLYIWLKQGALGLLVYLWILFAAFRLGLRGARERDDPWEGSWFALTASGTVFLAVYSLTDFPFSLPSPTFLLALLFGGSLAMAREGSLRFQWSDSGRAVVSADRSS